MTTEENREETSEDEPGIPESWKILIATILSISGAETDIPSSK